MKIKIGSEIFDAEKQPIMVILTKEDKDNIANMHPMATRYACFPDNCGMSKDEMPQWMVEAVNEWIVEDVNGSGKEKV